MPPAAANTSTTRSAILDQEYLKPLLPLRGEISELDLLRTPVIVFEFLVI